MVDEFRHGQVGPQFNRSDQMAGDFHGFNGQAVGDLMYASSASQLSRLAAGSASQILQITGGLPVWTSSPTLGAIILSEATAPAGTNAYIVRDNSGDVTINALTGKGINFAINGSDEIQHTTGLMAFLDNVGVVIGHPSKITVGGLLDGNSSGAPELQVLGKGQADASQTIARFGTTAARGPTLNFTRSLNPTIGSFTTVTEGDRLGAIVATGDDGTDYLSVATMISFEVDGTPGTGDMPGRIVFSTTKDGEQTVTPRWRIDKIGTLLAVNNNKIDLASAGSIENIGASGFSLTASGIEGVAGVPASKWTATQIVHKGTASSKLERTGSVTNTFGSGLIVQHTTDQNMIDGFGVAISFFIEDPGASDQAVGKVGFRRAGADNTGDFLVSTFVAGVENEAFKVTSGGKGIFDLGVELGGDLEMGNDNHIQRDANAGLTAGTTQTQVGGLALTAEFNEVSTVANTNDTVVLFTAVAGKRISIYNNGANALRIYPASGDNLGQGVDTFTTLASGSNIVFEAYDATNWKIV